MMIKKVFKLGRRGHHAISASVAAPFDMPSSIVITVEPTSVEFEFMYDLGHDEPTTGSPEKLAQSEVWFGLVSGRVMRIRMPQHEAAAMFDDLMAGLKQRREQLPAAPGTPLRRAAHYEFVGTELLPGLDAFIAEQLPQLRREGTR
jgi:hypothetical protein